MTSGPQGPVIPPTDDVLRLWLATSPRAEEGFNSLVRASDGVLLVRWKGAVPAELQSIADDSDPDFPVRIVGVSWTRKELDAAARRIAAVIRDLSDGIVGPTGDGNTIAVRLDESVGPRDRERLENSIRSAAAFIPVVISYRRFRLRFAAGPCEPEA